jgi:hypothetical protein
MQPKHAAPPSPKLKERHVDVCEPANVRDVQRVIPPRESAHAHAVHQCCCVRSSHSCHTGWHGCGCEAPDTHRHSPDTHRRALRPRMRNASQQTDDPMCNNNTTPISYPEVPPCSGKHPQPRPLINIDVYYALI